MTPTEHRDGTEHAAPRDRSDDILQLSFSFGGDPAEARIVARDGQPVEEWERGPVLADVLRALEREGWVMRAGHLARTRDTLLPQPMLVLARRSR